PADHVAAQITAAGGEAVAEHSDAADPDSGEAIVAAAVERWGRLDICVANAAIGPGGMFHKQPAAQFGEVLEINLQGSTSLVQSYIWILDIKQLLAQRLILLYLFCHNVNNDRSHETRLSMLI